MITPFLLTVGLLGMPYTFDYNEPSQVFSRKVKFNSSLKLLLSFIWTLMPML